MKKFTMMMIALIGFALFAQAAEWRAADMMEQARYGATRVYVVEHSDLTETNANTAQTLTVSVPAKTLVQLVSMELETAFDTANTNYTGSLAVTVGDGTDADLYLTSTELASDGSEVWKKFGALNSGTIAVTRQMGNVVYGTETNSLLTNVVCTLTSVALNQKVYTTADTIDFVFTPNSDEALVANSVGKVKFFIKVQ
jgi:hypothetical protein